ncbi:MAG: putative bacteriocin export ABC transporter [Candidatus Faecisoma sp.]|jgi:putative ABC transport system ATP-binding protein|nr:putative bacteriocin export ABC transporter [Acholeplasma sp.]MCI5677410.1 putative bacteriocin export ABC transporter [Acholeplasma sp.]MDY2892351.1 putative bacteriocin export ABC transporter [Candidatus Faecisoma sp.]
MIKVENLEKSFDNKEIIKNFNYEFLDGKITAIVGKSGCGKTTLLNILGLLDTDYKGKVLYDGVLITNESQRNEFIRNNINYLFQNYALIDNETVEQNLLLALEYEKLSKNVKKEKINEALELVDLNEFNDKKIFTLSGGEQQRVALARVILKKGNIILADEPTGNLDVENTDKVMKILKKLKEDGKLIIIVTHSLSLANECDDVIRW